MSPFTLISLEYVKGSFSNLCSTDFLLIKSNNASENRVKAMVLHCAWTDLHCVALCIVHCVLCTALIRVHWNDRRLITLRWGLWGSSRLKTFNPLTKGGHEGQSDIENWKWQIQHCSSFSLIQFYGYISIWAHRRLRMYIFGVAVQPCTQRHTHSRTRKNTSPTSGSNYVCSRDLSSLGTPWQNRLLLVPGCYPLVTFQIERTIIYHFLTVWNGIAPNVPNHEYIYIIE